QTVEIAVGVPQGFGDPDGSVAPDGGGDLLRLPVRERIGTAGAELEDVRHDEGNEAQRRQARLGVHVQQPVVQEVGHVELVGGGGGVGGDVAGPPQALVALRAVGGHREEVAADRKSTRLNSSHVSISYAVFC